MNRKGAGESLMFFVFLLIMLIVGSGIALGISIFFGQGYDFRQIESDILADKFVDCLQDNSREIDSDFDIISKCSFTENVKENHLIYAQRLNDGEEFFVGFYDYKVQCFIDVREENLNLPKCVVRNIDLDGVDYRVIVGSNQNSRRLVA